MKLRQKCFEFNVPLKKISEIAGVSRQTVSERIHGKKNRYWNEQEMIKIWKYFQTLNSSIKITDLFF